MSISPQWLIIWRVHVEIWDISKFTLHYLQIFMFSLDVVMNYWEVMLKQYGKRQRHGNKFSVSMKVWHYFNVEIFWFNFRTSWQQIYTVHQWSQKIPKGALVCIEEVADAGRSRAVWVACRHLPPKEHPQRWHATSSLVTPGRRVARKPGESNSSSNTFGIYLCMSGALPLLHLFTSSTSPDDL